MPVGRPGRFTRVAREQDALAAVGTHPPHLLLALALVGAGVSEHAGLIGTAAACERENREQCEHRPQHTLHL